MSTQDLNKATVRRFNKEFIEGGNMESFHQIIASDFINRSAPPGVPTGPEGVIYFFNQLLKPAFPDLTVEIADQVAEADKVTTRKSFHGTHKGAFMNIPASGRQVAFDVIDIIRLRDGKFVEHWATVDMQSLLMQITPQN